jgi:hypothetical protein
MRFEFERKENVIGFASHAARGPGTVTIDAQNFVTSEDGELLSSRLDQISAVFLRGHLGSLRETQIENLLVIHERSGRVTVHVNELVFKAQVRPKRDVSAGDGVLLNDILDIEAVEPVGHAIPDDAGIAILVSMGWRRALLYDFWPLNDDAQPLKRELPRLLASMFTYLMFRDRLTASDVEWSALIAQRWFPFASLPHDLLRNMIEHARAGWPVDDLLPNIVAHVRGELPRMREFVKKATIFERHRTVLLQAIDAYERNDFAIVVQALFPRIEGVLRDHTTKTRSNELPDAVTTRERQELSLLWPARFRDYVSETLFAWESFANPAQVSKVTRHSVAHGVANDALFDEKSATIALLVFQHLGSIFGPTLSKAST